jgi:hypothetical protein
MGGGEVLAKHSKVPSTLNNPYIMDCKESSNIFIQGKTSYPLMLPSRSHIRIRHKKSISNERATSSQSIKGA